MSKSVLHRYSKIEERKSNKKDFGFSLVVFFLSIILSIVISDTYKKYLNLLNVL